MQPGRIAALLAPFLGDDRLTADDLNHISTYIDILRRWNARINLTAIRDPEQIVARHFGESLFAARHLYPTRVAMDAVTGAEAAERRQSAAHGVSRGCAAAPDSAAEQRKKSTLADIGSGAGFPGLPIKLWAPGVAVTLIESNHKKSTFLREIARALTLTDINIQTTRAESMPHILFDTVTLRAVERFAQILPVATALVSPRGRLALLISSPQLAAAKPLLAGYSLANPIPVPESASRILLLAQRH